MFLQHITHIDRRLLYLPFFAGAASKMSHQALWHMNKPWTANPSARAGRVHHTCAAVHTLSENKVTTTAKRFGSDGFFFKFCSFALVVCVVCFNSVVFLAALFPQITYFSGPHTFHCDPTWHGCCLSQPWLIGGRFRKTMHIVKKCWEIFGMFYNCL